MEQGIGTRRYAFDGTLAEVPNIVFREQVFLFARDEFRAVNRKKPLPFFYKLITCIHKDVLHPAWITALNVCVSALIHLHHAGGSAFSGNRLAFASTCAHADALHPFWR